jgi:hypothetical protein
LPAVPIWRRAVRIGVYAIAFSIGLACVAGLMAWTVLELPAAVVFSVGMISIVVGGVIRWFSTK